MVLFMHTTEVPQLPTPSTGRNDLHNREAVNRSPLSTATQCASKLQTLLAGRKNTPSEALLSTCGPLLVETVKSMGEKFCAACAQCPPDQQGNDAHEDLASRQLRMGETLFYKVLENLIAEVRQPKQNVNVLLTLKTYSSGVFQRPLFACCLEIVMYCYNAQREFPWILDVLDLMPYDFLKVIEPVIRAEKKGLWHEVVKHLNNVDEQIVECLAWKENSLLWNTLERCGQRGPTFEEVQIERVQESTESNVAKAAPVADSSGGQPNFGSNKTALREGCATRSQAKTLMPVPSDPGPSTSKVPKENRPPQLPRSLAIFFRKVYHLAGSRLQNMCSRLPIEEADLQSKIWTCFEHSLVHCTKLMMNRHLDQLLLCAIYIVTKVSRFDTSFNDIRHCYRDQYQKKCHVYREVFMRTVPAHDVVDRCADCAPEPYGACGNTKVETADVIEFYNYIYRKDMTSYVMKFAPGSHEDETICLTPLPQAKSAVNLPKVQISPNVFVSPLKPNSYVALPNRRAYHFNQSPAKDLHEINLLVQGVENVKRRILLEDDDPEDAASPAKRLKAKIKAVMEDRQAIGGNGHDSGN